MTLALDRPYPTDDAAASYPVLRIAKALKTVSRADFQIDGDVKASDDDSLGVVITTEGDWQTVSIRRKTPPVKLVVTKSSSGNAVTVGSVWEDGRPAESGKDYLVLADTVTRVVRTGLNSQTPEVFQGDSLTLQGNTESNYLARLYLSTVSTTVNDLTLKPGSDIVTGSAKTGGSITEYTLAGNLLVDATRGEKGACISDIVGNTINLTARLSGLSDALLRVYPYDNRTGMCRISLQGDNTSYLGAIQVEQPTDKAALDSCEELSIEDERNLGGNPTVFSVDTLSLSAYACLTARRSLTIDDTNRGIYIKGQGQFNVPSAEDTLTVLSDLTIYGGSLHKVGPGTLRLGSTMRFGSKGTATKPRKEASRAIIEVREGALQILKGDSCALLQLKFAEGACLRIAPQDPLADETLRTKGVVLREDTESDFHIGPLSEGGSVLVDLVYDDSRQSGSFRVPLLTVPESIAETLRGSLRLAHTKVGEHAIALLERPVEDGVQFYAEYRAGLSIFVR